MKKTLIAMAAVAVAGVATAQVTITGVAGARFETQTADAGTETKGIYISDAAIKFSASEDLGGGLSAAASFGLDGMGNNDVIGATNTGSSLSVTAAGLGTVAMSNVDPADYLPLEQITTSGFSDAQQADRLTFVSESFNGAKLTVTYSDGNSGAGHTSGSTSTIYELDYAVGPFSANIGKMKVDSINNAAFDGGSRYKVSYDAGIAKLTYGAVDTKSNTGVKRDETGITLTAPVGALAVTAMASSSKTGTANKLSGTGFSVAYSLSKRTALSFEKRNWDSATAGVSPERTRLTLAHSF
jgi:predicted porin